MLDASATGMASFVWMMRKADDHTYHARTACGSTTTTVLCEPSAKKVDRAAECKQAISALIVILIGDGMTNLHKYMMLALAAIGLAAAGTAQAKTLAERCGSRVESGGTWGTWNLVSENPLFIIQEGSSRKTSEREIEDNFWANLEYSIQKEDAQQKQAASKLKKWLQCLTNKGKSGSDAQQTASTIPNCPPLLPASCVTWSLYDRQLNWWNVRNSCNKDAKVAFKGDSGTHEETQVFGSGEKTRVTWRGSREPAYVVWDAQASIKFYREKAPGAVLQCRKNMPF